MTVMYSGTSNKTISDTPTDEALTRLLCQAFSQPLALLGQSDASLSTWSVFWCVAANEGSTQVTVADRCGLSPKTVSRVISQLGESSTGRGWIRQSGDRTDRRVKRLSLTGEGRAVLRQMLNDLQNPGFRPPGS